MRSNSLFHLMRGALLASLLLLTACDQGISVDPFEETGPEVFFRFEQSSVSEHPLSSTTEVTGTFTASGAVTDRGSFEEVLAIGQSRIYGYRRLEGTQGTAVIQYSGSVSDDGRRGHVQFTIHQGTGAYAGIAGTGAFEMELSGPSALHAASPITARLSKR